MRPVPKAAVLRSRAAAPEGRGPAEAEPRRQALPVWQPEETPGAAREGPA